MSIDLPQGRFFPLQGVVEDYDGSSASLRPATLADVDAAADFHPDLESRVTAPTPEQVGDHTQRFHAGHGFLFYYDEELDAYYE